MYDSQYPQSRDARPGEVEMVLAMNGAKHKWQNNKSIRLDTSPCCNHHSSANPTFSINPENGLFICFYAACGKKGNWVSFCRLIGHQLRDNDKYVRHEVINFTEEWADHFTDKKRSPVSSGKYPAILEYCESRGISKDTLDAFKVSNKWGAAIQIPIFAAIEEEPYWVRVNARNVRVIDPKEEDASTPKNWFEVKGGPTYLMMGNNLLDPQDKHKRVFIFEGQWDMMTAYELGLRNVFSLPNGASNIKIASMLQYIPHDFDVYLCTDMDAAGDIAAEKFFLQVGGEKFNRLVLPHKDLNEWLKQKPDLTAEDVMKTARGVKAFQQRQSFEYSDFMTGVDEEETPIIDTPWEGLTDYIQGGFYKGQVTALLAPSGSGKTTIVNHVAMYTASKGVTCGLISLEDTAPRLHKKLRQVASGIDNGMTEGRKHLKLTQLHGQETTHQELIVQIDSMIIQGCGLVIVDNVNFISGDSREQLETFRKIISLVKNRKAHVIIVTQPKKIGAKSVSSEDQKGFSDAFQGTWNHINLNVCPTNDAVRIMHVEKCRDQWPGHNANVFLRYNRINNLYTQMEEIAVATTEAQGLMLLK